MSDHVTVKLDPKAVAAAREAGIDLSELLAEALRRRLTNLSPLEQEISARQWYVENRTAVDAYNAIIKADDFIFSDDVRMF